MNAMPTTGYLSVHGHKLAYRRAGSGPAVLLIHGMAGSSSTWNAVFHRLADNFTVLAPDLPGHGKSEKPRGDYSLGAFASVLRDFLLAMDIERATLVGQSLGGGVAMQLAYQHPEVCERLVLVNSGGLGDDVMPILRALTLPGAGFVVPLFAQNRIRSVIEGATGAIGKIGLRPSPEVVEMWKAYTSLIDPETRTAFLATLRSVVDHRGQRVSAMNRLYLAADVPTLIIWGDQDHVIPVRHAHESHEAIPHSELAIFEGSGHFPHCDDPERFAKTVAGFMASTEPVVMTPENRRALLVAQSEDARSQSA